MDDVRHDYPEDDDCEDQGLMATRTCVKFGCENAGLIQDAKTGLWNCPNCGSSYGAHPFDADVGDLQ